MGMPVIAFLYDFDKTLCTTDMQNYAFIPSLGMTPGEFWAEANGFGRRNRIDGILAYMYIMIQESERKNRPFTEGSSISGEFREIYASEFFYDENGRPVWPKLAVNFTAKTQFVYRINKGVLDVSDDKTLNDSMPDDSKRVPFRNMIYMGDGFSDVPCMKMMRAYGGQAIAVYQSENRAGVEELLARGRVDFMFPADYREDTALDATVKNIIRKMAITGRLIDENHRQFRRMGEGVLPNQVGLFDE